MAEGKEVKKLPMTLGDALEHLKNSEVVKRGLPGEMYRLYDEYKSDEYERIMATVPEKADSIRFDAGAGCGSFH